MTTTDATMKRVMGFLFSGLIVTTLAIIFTVNSIA
jgi:hypothetical protein